ncbi:hypothetical protein TRFO_11843 [Tritrichomonas foetus]|uniref:Uncharacterized protein n=1 Tax=Tritrichomonas foetus TaxID=1144522 RepID=A0A1J4J223_9EUKA|nr:hypothetical protein TRFO_11843 [Tritrichomonas foetus]|eukprot:OHS93418.1 hypothetical protein TRFO_11843 [Tritrichomonas foetus]
MPFELMNLNGIPAGCLRGSICSLEPSKVGMLSQTYEEMEDLCVSNSLWKVLYDNKFPIHSFMTKKREENIDWLSRYSKRYSIASNLKKHRPKVHSFNDDKINKIRTLDNAFAYNTPDKISLIVYEYFDDECTYEKAAEFTKKNHDFLFLDNNSLLSVKSNNFTIFDITKQTKKLKQTQTLGINPILERMSQNVFSVVSDSKCSVFDTRDSLHSICTFWQNGHIIGSSHDGSILYVACKNHLTAHDTKNPRGPVLWHSYVGNKISFFSANVKERRAIYGNHIINLDDGEVCAYYNYPDTTTAAVVNDHIAVFGHENRSAVFYNYENCTVAGCFQFGEDEGIKSIDPAIVNNTIAIAADYNITILKTPDEAGNVEQIRSVQCGSIAQRKRGDIGPVKQIVFDGERLITNMETFVRVYDFYTGKSDV